MGCSTARITSSTSQSAASWVGPSTARWRHCSRSPWCSLGPVWRRPDRGRAEDGRPAAGWSGQRGGLDSRGNHEGSGARCGPRCPRDAGDRNAGSRALPSRRRRVGVARSLRLCLAARERPTRFVTGHDEISRAGGRLARGSSHPARRRDRAGRCRPRHSGRHAGHGSGSGDDACLGIGLQPFEDGMAGRPVDTRPLTRRFSRSSPRSDELLASGRGRHRPRAALPRGRRKGFYSAGGLVARPFCSFRRPSRSSPFRASPRPGTGAPTTRPAGFDSAFGSGSARALRFARPRRLAGAGRFLAFGERSCPARSWFLYLRSPWACSLS